MNTYSRILLLLFSIVSLSVFSQNIKETYSSDLPHKTYLPKDYKADPQIYGINQTENGIIYFGNNTGVLEYDGVNWRNISISSSKSDLIANFITKHNNEIYVGSDNDYGKLVTDSTGKLIFKSELYFGNVDSVNKLGQLFFNNETRYLRTANELIIVNKGEHNRISSETEFLGIYLCNKTIFVNQKDLGLFELQGNQLKRYPEGVIFSNKKIINIIFHENFYFVITEKDGIFKSKDFEDFEKVFDLKNKIVTSSIKIDETLFSIGTFSRGIEIYDFNFNLITKFGVEKGLNDPTIKCQYIDKDGNLWLGTNNGITRFEYNTPLHKYSKSSGLKGSVEGVARFYNNIYSACLDGLYMMNEVGTFQKVMDISKDCFGLNSIQVNDKNFLFVSEVDAVYSIDKNGISKEVQKGGPYNVLQSPLDPNLLIALHYDGLATLKYDNKSFITTQYHRKFNDAEIFNFTITKDGTVWIGSMENGVYKTHVSELEKENPNIEHLFTKEGLVEGPSYIFNYENDIYVGTNDGLFKLVGNKFKLGEYFGIDFTSAKKGVHRINADSKGNIWMVLFDQSNKFEVGYSKKENDKYNWQSEKFVTISESIIHNIFHESNGISWLGGSSGVIRYDDNLKVNYTNDYNAIIRSFSQGDSIIYWGSSVSNLNKVTLAYSKSNSIQFHFSATSFYDESKTMYSFILEGYDEKWSDWTDRTLKEYNLSEGTYTFKVKAKNLYNKVSKIDSISFTINPPWYRSIFAYIAYVVIFILIIYLIILISLRRVKQQNLRLELIIKDRTQEIIEQKAEVEKQRDLTAQKNEEILDSINYAKRIQNAILPPIELIKSFLPNSFVLYKPKDIVAGDFYWLEQKDNRILFAACDCTGHGVPGAMVSVICVNGLNRSVREYGLTEPGKILDKTREIVIQEFEKSEEEVKDGMDLALCCIDGNKLYYAGANNPLWIIRKDSTEIEEIKADKQPIGKYAEPKPYTTNSTEINKGDTIYIFSDGYADQFGGDFGKKFKSANLKKLLLSIQKENIENQKEIINQAFEDWKGKLEQLDDVCLIGVRF